MINKLIFIDKRDEVFKISAFRKLIGKERGIEITCYNKI